MFSTTLRPIYGRRASRFPGREARRPAYQLGFKSAFWREIVGFEWSYVPMVVAMGTYDYQPLTTQLSYDVRQCVVACVAPDWPSWRGHGLSPCRVREGAVHTHMGWVTPHVV